MTYKFLNNNAKKCMQVINLIVLVTLSILLIITKLIINNFIPTKYLNIVNIIIISLIILQILDILFITNIRYKRYKYIITDEKIEIIEGAFFIEKTIIPIERIHQISIKQGPIDRLYNLGKVSISTAGSNATINFLDVSEANLIGDMLKNKVNKILLSDTQDGEINE